MNEYLELAKKLVKENFNSKDVTKTLIAKGATKSRASSAIKTARKQLGIFNLVPVKHKSLPKWLRELRAKRRAEREAKLREEKLQQLKAA